MSLIGLRRDRRRDSPGPQQPPRLWKLVVAFALVGFLVWYLNRLA
jgi:hypothetical protein